MPSMSPELDRSAAAAALRAIEVAFAHEPPPAKAPLLDDVRRSRDGGAPDAEAQEIGRFFGAKRWTEIRQAFTSAKRPRDGALHQSEESDEASSVLEADFRDKHDWRTLTPEFLDQAPDGWASALTFFSDEAFRYFLPACLIADLDGK